MIKKSLKNLLNSIISLKPPEREALKPALQTFTSHSLIQPLLSKKLPLPSKAHFPKPQISQTSRKPSPCLPKH
jgi:hypothetical protein